MSFLRSLLAALVGLVLAVPGAGAWDESVDELLDQIRRAGNRVPARVFEALGEKKSAEAFEALKDGVVLVNGAEKLEQAYAAFRHFAGVEDVERQAIDFLVERAESAQEDIRRAAARALSRMGPGAWDQEEKLLRRGKDEDVRGLVLRAMLEEYRRRGDARSLEMILDSYVPPFAGTHEELVAILEEFQGQETFDVLLAAVESKKVSPLAKRAVLEFGAKLPHEKADDLLVEGLKSKDAVVQFAALTALIEHGRLERVSEIQKLTRSQDDALRKAAWIALSRVRGSEPGFVESLFELAAANDPVERQAAVVALGEVRTVEAVEALYPLLRDPDRSVRVQALQTVGSLRRKDSVAPLIDRADGEDVPGLRRDVLTVLRLLTGEDQGASADRWREWWREEGERFELVDLAEAEERERDRARRREASSTQVPAFYGLDVVSDRVVFVLDVSGSMRWGRRGEFTGGERRIVAAKRELTGVLERLPEGSSFNVIFFSQDVITFEDALAPMNAKAREEVLRFVDRVIPNGATNVFGALTAAFEDARVDTIYLMTDGTPTVGEIVNSASIRAEVQLWNSTRKVTIHCIAAGEEGADLLLGLAADSGGDFRSVFDD